LFSGGGGEHVCIGFIEWGIAHAEVDARELSVCIFCRGVFNYLSNFIASRGSSGSFVWVWRSLIRFWRLFCWTFVRANFMLFSSISEHNVSINPSTLSNTEHQILGNTHTCTSKPPIRPLSTSQHGIDTTRTRPNIKAQHLSFGIISVSIAITSGI